MNVWQASEYLKGERQESVYLQRRESESLALAARKRAASKQG